VSRCGVTRKIISQGIGERCVIVAVVYHVAVWLIRSFFFGGGAISGPFRV
jgi:hypothetical protein